MATSTPAKAPRKTPPLCGTCHHPKSFHRKGEGECRSIGCRDCQKFTPMRRK